MTFTRARDLVAAGLVAAVLAYLAFQAFYGELPPLPIFAGLMLLVLAVVELCLGFVLRTRIRDARAVQPLTYARAVALAKASSVLGALMLGAWLAGLVYLVPERGRLAAADADLPAAITGVISAAALVAGALWLEHCCRTPRDRDDQQGREFDPER